MRNILLTIYLILGAKPIYAVQINGSQINPNTPVTVSSMTTKAARIATASISTTPELVVISSGPKGTTVGSSGSMLLDVSKTDGMGFQIYNAGGARSATGGLLDIENTHYDFNQPFIYMQDTSTASGHPQIRMDSRNPNQEYVETDQVAPAGRFETDGNNNLFRINSRNAANSSFETITTWGQLANGGPLTHLGTLDIAGASTFASSITINGNVLKVRGSDGDVIFSSAPVNPGILLWSNGGNANRRNWGLYTNYSTDGDMVIVQGVTPGGSPYGQTQTLTLTAAENVRVHNNLQVDAASNHVGASTFQSSMTVTGNSNPILLINSTAGGAPQITFDQAGSGGVGFIYYDNATALMHFNRTGAQRSGINIDGSNNIFLAPRQGVGNVSIGASSTTVARLYVENAGTSQAALTVKQLKPAEEVAGFTASNTSGQSNGVRIRAGTTGADFALKIEDAGGAATQFEVTGITTRIGSGGTPLAVISTGTYSPTLTCITNCAASVISSAFIYERIGNVVYVFGGLTVDATSGGSFTQVDISLPVASNLTSAYQLIGLGINNGGTGNAFGNIAGDPTNDRGNFFLTPTSGNNLEYFVHFHYVVQ